MLPGATPEEQLAVKRALEWRRKNPVGSPGWQQAAAMPAPTAPAGELPPTNPAQPPVYQNQPLAAAQPQGVSKVDETEDTEVPAGALDFATMTPETYSRMLGETQSQIAKLAPVMGEKDYEAAKQKLMERRFGPSRAEQLFALSAALARPTYAGNRFGQILGNVAPALGEVERQRREADEARESALEQLKQQYLTGQSANQRAQLEGRLGLLRAAGQMIKPKAPFSYQLDQTGNVREVPKPESVHRPSNKAEYDAIPVGDYYLVPSGPNAGKVVRKLPQG